MGNSLLSCLQPPWRMPAIYNNDGRLTQEQLDCFTEAFRMFDSDGSGTISCGEFRDVCLAVGMTPTDDELKALIGELDQDGSGDIYLKEFLTAMQSKTQDPEGEEIIMEAFKIMDADGSGALSHAEMRDVLQHLGEKMDDEEITDLINTVDLDGDGEVDLKEFLAVILDRAFV